LKQPHALLKLAAKLVLPHATVKNLGTVAWSTVGWGVASSELQNTDAEDVRVATCMVDTHLSITQPWVAVVEAVAEPVRGPSKQLQALLRDAARLVVPQATVRNRGTVAAEIVATDVARTELQKDEADEVRDVTYMVDRHLSAAQLVVVVGVVVVLVFFVVDVLVLVGLVVEVLVLLVVVVLVVDVLLLVLLVVVVLVVDVLVLLVVVDFVVLVDLDVDVEVDLVVVEDVEVLLVVVVDPGHCPVKANAAEFPAGTATTLVPQST